MLSPMLPACWTERNTITIQLKRKFLQWCLCCDVAVAQSNYPSLKHNTQDSIEHARGRSHKEDLVQIFMLYVMQLGVLICDDLNYGRN